MKQITKLVHLICILYVIQECCYDLNINSSTYGTLLTLEDGYAGGALFYNPFYYYNDYITWDRSAKENCCFNSIGDYTNNLCHLYYNARSVDNCVNYATPQSG